MNRTQYMFSEAFFYTADRETYVAHIIINNTACNRRGSLTDQMSTKNNTVAVPLIVFYLYTKVNNSWFT